MTDYAEAIADVAQSLRLLAVNRAQGGQAPGYEEIDAMVDKLNAAAGEISRLQEMVCPAPASKADIKKLPGELRSQLSTARIDAMDEKIVTIINSHEGIADLDQILVGLYLKFNILQKRRYLQSKLFRLSRRRVVSAVPGKKGAYRTLRRAAMTA